MMNSYATGGAMRRREEILRIVGQSAVHSQDEILVALSRRGLTVTQPTLSRDLRELGLLKGPSGYTAPSAAGTITPLPPPAVEHRFEQLVRDFVVSADAAMNLVVVKTPPATAQPLASAVDAAAIDGAIGTVGGDDTIFIAFRTPAAASAFARRVHEIAGLTPARRRTRS